MEYEQFDCRLYPQCLTDAGAKQLEPEPDCHIFSDLKESEVFKGLQLSIFMVFGEGCGVNARGQLGVLSSHLFHRP